MNELINCDNGFLIPPSTAKKDKITQSFNYRFSPQVLANKVLEILSIDEEMLRKKGEYAYDNFIYDEKFMVESLASIRQFIKV